MLIFEIYIHTLLMALPSIGELVYRSPDIMMTPKNDLLGHDLKSTEDFKILLKVLLGHFKYKCHCLLNATNTILSILSGCVAMDGMK